MQLPDLSLILAAQTILGQQGARLPEKRKIARSRSKKKTEAPKNANIVCEPRLRYSALSNHQRVIAARAARMGISVEDYSKLS